jgi:hypothetical protein
MLVYTCDVIVSVPSHSMSCRSGKGRRASPWGTLRLVHQPQSRAQRLRLETISDGLGHREVGGSCALARGREASATVQHLYPPACHEHPAAKHVCQYAGSTGRAKPAALLLVQR